MPYPWGQSRLYPMLYLGIVPAMAWQFLGIPGTLVAARSLPAELLLAQSQCDDTSSPLVTAQEHLAQGQFNLFLQSVDEALRTLNVNAQTCSVFIAEFGQSLSDELQGRGSLDDPETLSKLAVIVEGLRRIADAENLDQQEYSPQLHHWLGQLNQLLSQLPQSKGGSNARLPAEIATLRAATDIAKVLLAQTQLPATDQLIADSLQQFQRYGLSPAKQIDRSQTISDTAADRASGESAQLSVRITALSGIEAIGYGLFAQGRTEESEATINQLGQMVAPLQGQLLLERTATADLSQLSGLPLAQRVALVRALAATASVQPRDCSDRCGVLTLLQIISSPSIQPRQPNQVEPLRVRAAALAGIEDLADINSLRFSRTLLPILQDIAQTTTSTTEIAIRTQAADIASRMGNQIRRNASSPLAQDLALSDDQAILALLDAGLKPENDEAVRLNAQSIFARQYRNNLSQLASSIQQARTAENETLLETAIRSAGGVNYRRLDPQDASLRQLVRELTATLTEDFYEGVPASSTTLKSQTAFALGQIATVQPDLLLTPNPGLHEQANVFHNLTLNSRQDSGLVALLNLLFDPSPEVVVQASYALSRYGVTLYNQALIAETLTGLNMPFATDNLAGTTAVASSLQACLWQIIDRTNREPALEQIGSGATHNCVRSSTAATSEAAAVAAAFILGQIGVEDGALVSQLLEILKQEESPDIRESILVYALGSIAPNNADAIMPLIDFYSDPQNLSDVILQAQIMDIIDTIAPEDPGVVDSFFRSLQAYVFSQSLATNFETQVLATSAIENIALKAQTFSPGNQAISLRASLKTVQSNVLASYLRRTESSMLVCSGVAFATARIGISANELEPTNILRRLSTHRSGSSFCQPEDLPDLEPVAENRLQENLVHSGAISALGSLEANHPARAEIFQLLSTSINARNSIEVNRAALRSSTTLVLSPWDMNNGCNVSVSYISKIDQERAIVNLLKPFSSNFTSSSTTVTNVQEIRAEALQQIKELLEKLQEKADNCSEAARTSRDPLLLQNQAYYQYFLTQAVDTLLSEVVELHSQKSPMYLDILQVLSILNPNFLRSVSPDSARSYLQKLGVLGDSYTGIAADCVVQSRKDELSQETACSTIVLLIGGLWQDADQLLTSQTPETQISAFGESLRFLTGSQRNRQPLATHPSRNVRASVAFTLGEMGFVASETEMALQQLLSDDAPRVRDSAIAAIARLDSSNLLTSLRQNLDSPNALTRQRAANALGRIAQMANSSGQSAWRDGTLARAITAQLMYLSLHDDVSTVRREAIFALGYTSPGDSTVAQTLSQIVASTEAEDDGRIVAAYALGQLGSANAETLAVLIQALIDTNSPTLQASAAYAIAQLTPNIPTSDQHQLLSPLLRLAGNQNQNERSRAMAHYALGKLAASATTFTARDFNSIDQAFRSSFNDETVSENLRIVTTTATRDLPQWSHDLTSSIVAEANSGNFALRFNAVTTLGSLPDNVDRNLRNQATATLVKIVANEQENPSVRLEACKSLFGATIDNLCAATPDSTIDQPGILDVGDRAQATPLVEIAVALNELQKLANTLRAPNYFTGYRSSTIELSRSGEAVFSSFQANDTLSMFILLEIIRAGQASVTNAARDRFSSSSRVVRGCNIPIVKRRNACQRQTARN